MLVEIASAGERRVRRLRRRARRGGRARAGRSCGSSIGATSSRTCSAPEGAAMSAWPETTGTIYDIGYRHYEGPRLGRRGAVGADRRRGAARRLRARTLRPLEDHPVGRRDPRLLPAVVAVAIRVLAGETSSSSTATTTTCGASAGCFRSSSPPRRPSSSSTTSATTSCRSTSAGRSSRFDYVARQARGPHARPARADPAAAARPLRRAGARRRGPARRRSVMRSGALPAIVGSGVLHAVVLGERRARDLLARRAPRLRGRRGPRRLPRSAG